MWHHQYLADYLGSRSPWNFALHPFLQWRGWNVPCLFGLILNDELNRQKLWVYRVPNNEKYVLPIKTRRFFSRLIKRDCMEEEAHQCQHFARPGINRCGTMQTPFISYSCQREWNNSRTRFAHRLWRMSDCRTKLYIRRSSLPSMEESRMALKRTNELQNYATQRGKFKFMTAIKHENGRSCDWMETLTVHISVQIRRVLNFFTKKSRFCPLKCNFPHFTSR